MPVIDAFVAHLRHELRTPVNAIIGYGQLLLEEEGSVLTADARADLERVIEAGHQMLRVVLEALDPVELTADDVPLCAARIRHAFQTPLTTVQGLVYLLLEGPHGTSIGDDLRRIDAAAVRLARVSDR